MKTEILGIFLINWMWKNTKKCSEALIPKNNRSSSEESGTSYRGISNIWSMEKTALLRCSGFYPAQKTSIKLYNSQTQTAWSWSFTSPTGKYNIGRNSMTTVLPIFRQRVFKSKDTLKNKFFLMLSISTKSSKCKRCFTRLWRQLSSTSSMELFWSSWSTPIFKFGNTMFCSTIDIAHICLRKSRMRGTSMKY